MRRTVRWAVVLAVPLIFVAINVRLLATDAFLAFEFGREGFPAPVGMSDAERLALAGPSTRFIVGGIDSDQLAALSQDGRALYGEGEIRHLADVRALVQRISVLGLVCVAIGSGLGLVTWRDRRRRAEWWRSIEHGGALTIALVIVAAAGVLLAWRSVFVSFHELLFPPGTWQFSGESGLIRLFPERFWFDSAIAFAVLLLVEGGLAIAAGRIGRRSGHVAAARALGRPSR